MKISQVAAQLYTLRDHLKTPAEVAETLKKVRAIGYQAVQVSGMGPIDETELVRILDNEGLTCCATHEPGNLILDDTAKVIERLHKLGCRYTAYPYPAGIDFQKPDHIETLANKLDVAGAAMAKAGQVLTYHNHAHEFAHYQGRTVLEFMYAATNPRHLQGEIDTYWVQAGGGDPAAWCRRLKGRLPLLHLKDYGVGADGKPYFAEIGRGNLDWPEIITAAEASGCQWFIVEQDVCPGDPFESLAISFRCLQEKFADG
ncbi:MAG: sugar phosphate isomerase/epimerase [Methylacidiphilales bacterium]|nr:sugar phosphate isomerase/epimerase [Candidatus Methylacidiphilales bacterium]